MSAASAPSFYPRRLRLYLIFTVSCSDIRLLIFGQGGKKCNNTFAEAATHIFVLFT